MSDDFVSKTSMRYENIEGFSDWLWVTRDGYEGDGGAWYGPKIDWENSHKDKYFTHVKNFSSAIQAGGNCGMYPRIFSKFFKTVYTFEPDALNFYCLVNNCRTPNIIKFNSALGETHKRVSLNRGPETNVGMHTIRETESDSNIPVLMIDDLNLDNVGLIQLDVEGYEYNILLGAIETIVRSLPVIILERPSPECIEFLKNLNYTIKDTSVSDTIFAAI